MSESSGSAMDRLSDQVRSQLTDPEWSQGGEYAYNPDVPGLNEATQNPKVGGMSLFELCEHMAQHSDRNAAALERIADSLDEIKGHLRLMATDDPLARAERAGDEPGQSRPIEETMR